jgi:hypothetical protein
MKFLVNDTQSERHLKIRSFLKEETAVIAVLLAAVDLKWTLRRAIIALGRSPTPELRSKKMSSLENRAGTGYRNVWKAEVAGQTSMELDQLIGDWNGLKNAYELRHKIIHGTQGTTGLAYAAPRVERILGASKKICEFAQQNGRDLFDRLPVRRIRKTAARAKNTG